MVNRQQMILNTGKLTLTFNGESGVLERLDVPGQAWQILDRPSLGLSWRLMVPLDEEHRNNEVLGEKQKLTTAHLLEKSLVLIWDGVESEKGGHLDIKLTLTVGDEDGQAVFRLSIDNLSPYTVENVYCPYLGDVGRPDQAAWMKTFAFVYANAKQDSLWPRFDNHCGYFGVDYPTQLYPANPSIPFILLRSESQGLYVGVKSHDAELVTWTCELRPGYGSSIDFRVPEDREIAGKPVHTRFAALHIPYILPGERRDLTPIALDPFVGDWHAGADIYKKWRSEWMQPAQAPDWARMPHAWQQIHINSPEDELRMRFVDLPDVARACKKHGVAAIQLVGWNDGGQDQGNPSHDPDPRLGTFEELKDAIRQCQQLGVKIILFAKFVWVDRGLPNFHGNMDQYAVTDPYGDYYLYPGYRYFTGTQLMDINTKRLIPACFNNEAYMQLCEREFKKLVDLGADGMLFDECLHHSPTWVCFNPNHGHRYGEPTYNRDSDFVTRMRQVEGTPPDFLYAGEACYDWQMSEYQLSYFRTENRNHVPLARYLLPFGQYMTAVTGFNDRNMINQCLLYRYVISYEPYNFKGSLDDFPDTIHYGCQMDELRTQYRKWFWDGEFLDNQGARVTGADGLPYHPFTVFRADDGSVALAVANYDDEPVIVTASMAGDRLAGKMLLVGETTWSTVDGSIALPPRSAAIILPEGK